MYAEGNGISIYYEKKGQGRPLLMVHGNGEDHTIFDKAINLLQEHFTCYAVDSRNHGKSGSKPELHYEDMARDMIAFMEELDLQDVVFYGFSDGGIIGLMAAAMCPRIKTLIVSGANLSPDGVKPWVNTMFRVIYKLNKDPKIALMLNEPDISENLLSDIRAHTLVLAGSRDLILEKETRRIASSIPGAKLHILEGEGHGSYIVHKEKIARLILVFVQQE